MTPELRFVLADRDALAREHDRNLRHGRALVPERVELECLAIVRLVLERGWDGGQFAVEAIVVMILPEGPVTGTALELRFAEGERDALARFVSGETPAPAPAPTAAALDDALPTLESQRPVGPGARSDGGGDADLQGDSDDSDVSEDSEDSEDDAIGATSDPKIVRIRRLSAVERMRLARDGSLEDRVLLERCFGKALWEDLLRNPGITPPEVARIANKGTAPRVLLDQIVDNASWSRQSIVRRALLGNPRLSADGIGKLLRGLPKNELKLIALGGAFPAAVRTLAKKLSSD